MYCKLIIVEDKLFLCVVLIVAKCIVNTSNSNGATSYASVLIVAKCIVNVNYFYRIYLLS